MMKVKDLLKVTPKSLVVSYIVLTDGRPILEALREKAIPVDLDASLTIHQLAVAIECLDEEDKLKAYDWEIDTKNNVQAFKPRREVKMPDDKAVDQVNTIYGWTTCLTTLMMVGAIAWNIVINHEYPKTSLMVVVLFPITIATIWLLGILRNRQSLMSIVIGDGEERESLAKAVVKSAASAITNHGKK